MFIAGDIGGTKTNLALFDAKQNDITPLHLETFHSPEYQDLETILFLYLQKLEKAYPYNKNDILALCLAVAAPIREGRCKLVNLPWIIDERNIAKETSIQQVSLINDLEANAYGISVLKDSDFSLLFEGEPLSANKAVIAPGTGLGEAGLFWDGKTHHPFACEGGHADFAPKDSLQIELLNYLLQKYSHVSWERIVSGPGIYRLYQFFRDYKKREEPIWLKEEISKLDPPAVISEHALKGDSEICSETLDLFVSIFGAESGNLALKMMAFGGIYLGGGIPPKILPLLKKPLFHEALINKGRLKEVLQKIPVKVILDQKTALKGAARYCTLFHQVN